MTSSPSHTQATAAAGVGVALIARNASPQHPAQTASVQTPSARRKARSHGESMDSHLSVSSCDTDVSVGGGGDALPPLDMFQSALLSGIASTVKKTNGSEDVHEGLFVPPISLAFSDQSVVSALTSTTDIAGVGSRSSKCEEVAGKEEEDEDDDDEGEDSSATPAVALSKGGGNPSQLRPGSKAFKKAARDARRDLRRRHSADSAASASTPLSPVGSSPPKDESGGARFKSIATPTSKSSVEKAHSGKSVTSFIKDSSSVVSAQTPVAPGQEKTPLKSLASPNLTSKGAPLASAVSKVASPIANSSTAPATRTLSGGSTTIPTPASLLPPPSRPDVWFPHSWVSHHFFSVNLGGGNDSYAYSSASAGGGIEGGNSSPATASSSFGNSTIGIGGTGMTTAPTSSVKNWASHAACFHAIVAFADGSIGVISPQCVSSSKGTVLDISFPPSLVSSSGSPILRQEGSLAIPGYQEPALRLKAFAEGGGNSNSSSNSGTTAATGSALTNSATASTAQNASNAWSMGGIIWLEKNGKDASAANEASRALGSDAAPASAVACIAVVPGRRMVPSVKSLLGSGADASSISNSSVLRSNSGSRKAVSSVPTLAPPSASPRPPPSKLEPDLIFGAFGKNVTVWSYFPRKAIAGASSTVSPTSSAVSASSKSHAPSPPIPTSDAAAKPSPSSQGFDSRIAPLATFSGQHKHTITCIEAYRGEIPTLVPFELRPAYREPLEGEGPAYLGDAPPHRPWQHVTVASGDASGEVIVWSAATMERLPGPPLLLQGSSERRGSTPPSSSSSSVRVPSGGSLPSSSLHPRSLASASAGSPVTEAVTAIVLNHKIIAAGGSDGTVVVWKRKYDTTTATSSSSTSSSSSSSSSLWSSTSCSLNPLPPEVIFRETSAHRAVKMLRLPDEARFGLQALLSGGTEGDIRLWYLRASPINRVAERFEAIRHSPTPPPPPPSSSSEMDAAEGGSSALEAGGAASTSIIPLAATVAAVTTLLPSRLLRGHSACITGLHIDNNKIVSCSQDGTVKLWDVAEPHVGRILQTLRLPAEASTLSVAGDVLSCGLIDGRIVIYSFDARDVASFCDTSAASASIASGGLSMFLTSSSLPLPNLPTGEEALGAAGGGRRTEASAGKRPANTQRRGLRDLRAMVKSAEGSHDTRDFLEDDYSAFDFQVDHDTFS